MAKVAGPRSDDRKGTVDRVFDHISKTEAGDVAGEREFDRTGFFAQDEAAVVPSTPPQVHPLRTKKPVFPETEDEAPSARQPTAGNVLRKQDGSADKVALWRQRRRDEIRAHTQRSFADRSLSPASPRTPVLPSTVIQDYAQVMRMDNSPAYRPASPRTPALSSTAMPSPCAPFSSTRRSLLLLRFPDAPWPPPYRFEAELLRSLRDMGATQLANLKVKLREGSVIAELRGPAFLLADLCKLPLYNINVLGFVVGEVRSAECGPPDPDEAATKIEASYRGWRGREEAKSRRRHSLEQQGFSQPAWNFSTRKEKDKAATKIQARARGNAARKQVKGMRQVRSSKKQPEVGSRSKPEAVPPKVVAVQPAQVPLQPTPLRSPPRSPLPDNCWGGVVFDNTGEEYLEEYRFDSSDQTVRMNQQYFFPQSLPRQYQASNSRSPSPHSHGMHFQQDSYGRGMWTPSPRNAMMQTLQDEDSWLERVEHTSRYMGILRHQQGGLPLFAQQPPPPQRGPAVGSEQRSKSQPIRGQAVEYPRARASQVQGAATPSQASQDDYGDPEQMLKQANRITFAIPDPDNIDLWIFPDKSTNAKEQENNEALLKFRKLLVKTHGTLENATEAIESCSKGGENAVISLREMGIYFAKALGVPEPMQQAMNLYHILEQRGHTHKGRTRFRCSAIIDILAALQDPNADATDLEATIPRASRKTSRKQSPRTTSAASKARARVKKVVDAKRALSRAFSTPPSPVRQLGDSSDPSVQRRALATVAHVARMVKQARDAKLVTAASTSATHLGTRSEPELRVADSQSQPENSQFRLATASIMASNRIANRSRSQTPGSRPAGYIPTSPRTPRAAAASFPTNSEDFRVNPSVITNQYLGFRNPGGQRDGFGVLRGTDGTTYSGQWNNGKRDGHGTLFFDGGVFEGDWKSGLAQGPGKVYFKNGDHFTGTYDLNKKDGFGSYRWADGAMEEGKYFEGVKIGWHVWSRGTETWDIQYDKGRVIGAMRKDGHRQPQPRRRSTTASPYTPRSAARKDTALRKMPDKAQKTTADEEPKNADGAEDAAEDYDEEQY